MNPAEFFSDLISIDFSSTQTEEETRKRLNHLLSAFAEKKNSAVIPLPESSEGNGEDTIPQLYSIKAGKRPGWWTQFKLLLKRAWRQVAFRFLALHFVLFLIINKFSFGISRFSSPCLYFTCDLDNER